MQNAQRMSCESKQRYFAVKVRTRGEIAVGVALRHKGYDVMMPTYTARKRYSDRVKKAQHALFPGYVFVRMDPQQLLPLVQTEGVSYVVKSGSSLAPLPVDEALALESLCKVPTECEPCENFQVGQRVLIDSGPLQGLKGLLTRVGDRDRLVISINSIFSSVSVDLKDTVVRTIHTA